jgi:hypothetical protein
LILNAMIDIGRTAAIDGHAANPQHEEAGPVRIKGCLRRWHDAGTSSHTDSHIVI